MSLLTPDILPPDVRPPDIRQVAANSPDATALMAALNAHIASRHPGQPIHGIVSENFEATGGLFFILYLRNAPAACGALRPIDATTTEVKRMFVHAAHRRHGLARLMLAHLERTAAAQGYPTVRLETGKALPEAVALYCSAGWTEIPAYGEYIGSPVSVCFEKRLGRQA